MQYIGKEQIEKILTMSACIEQMRLLFLLNPKTEIQNPLRTKMVLPNHGILGMMPASIPSYGVMGIKVINIFPQNAKLGLGTHLGLVHLFDIATGQLLLTLDAESITAIRTAAVSALMTDYLAIDTAKTLCLLGSGKQAETHLEAILHVRKIEKVMLWSNTLANAQKFKTVMQAKYNLDFQVCFTVKEAAETADIICTLTSSKTPILFNDYLKKDVHINAVGACTPTTRELDSAVIHHSAVYVDNYEAAFNEAGDLLLASMNEENFKEHITSDIHELLMNPKAINKNNKTVFKSLGIAIEDVAVARYCYLKLKNNIV